MSEIRTLIQQIRFSLSNLGAQNRHHDFEVICRNFSRNRLGLNILPATGPVSAGGDQGRDFETYTILPEVKTTGERELLSSTAAFACTIQKDNLPAKIKNDSKKIVEDGSKVDLIYFFILENLEVSKRHKLQKWVQKKYSVKLEIFDGEFLAENLADKDLFWIAIEYLHISSSLYPVTSDIDYLKTKEEWENRTISFPNYAIFAELRNLGRRCLFDKETKQDLLFWLQKIEQLLNLDLPSEFRRKALYEIVALKIRGTGTLAGWEKYARSYFELSTTYNNQIEAQEASVVLNYAFGSKIRGASVFTNKELRKWRSSVENYADQELKKEYPKTIQAVIYELKGYLLLTNPYNRNIDEGLDWWLKLSAIIKETPLFPLERFSNVLVGMIDYIPDNPKYEQLNQQIDILLGERIGGFAVAEKCRDRAIAYRKKGELLKSLKEFHKVKVNWYTHETLYGSLLSMLLIAETYHDLGLIYAAKQYALAVAFIAQRAREESEKVFLPRGLSVLAEYEYTNGEWANFLEHADLSLRALGLFTRGLDDQNAEEIYQKMSFYASLVSVFTDIFSEGAILKYVKERINKWNDDIIEDLLSLARDSWSKKPTEDILQQIQSEFKSCPFNDVGQRRSVTFDAAGITWKFSWKNGLCETAKAEQLISLLQILLVESIEEDLYLIKGKAWIDISLGSEPKAQRQHTHPKDDEFTWSVILFEKRPIDKKEINEFHLATLCIAIQILSEFSLLPNSRIKELLRKLFEDGFLNKALAGNSYEIMFLDLVPEQLYDEILKLPKVSYLESLEFNISTHKLLDWKDSIIAEYNRDQSESLIRNRYKNTIVPINLTLRVLNSQPSFKETIRKLKLDGWKDWHVLMAIASIVVNYRINYLGVQNSIEAKKKFTEQMSLKETAESIVVPLANFTEIELRNHLSMSMPSTLKILGFEYKSYSLSVSALHEFLTKRCHYFIDDVPHEDFFAFD